MNIVKIKAGLVRMFTAIAEDYRTYFIAMTLSSPVLALIAWYASTSWLEGVHLFVFVFFGFPTMAVLIDTLSPHSASGQDW